MTENNKEQVLQTIKLDSIGYTGKIQASIMLGDRMISSKTYYNNGTSKLFEFFATCLTGNWLDAKATRPCKIILFKKDPSETEEFDADYWTNAYAISTEIFQDTAIPRKSSGEDGGYEAVYHFRVPFLLLTGGNAISKIGLYPKTISSKADDLMAYFFLTTPIDVPIISGNLTIIIDWTLKISNKIEA